MDIRRLTAKKWNWLNVLRKVIIPTADILALLLKIHLQLMSALDNIYVIYNNFDYFK